MQIMIFCTLSFTVASCILSLFLKSKSTRDKKAEINEKNILKVFLVARKYFFSIPGMIYQGVGLNITYQILPKYILETAYTGNITKPVFMSIFYIIYGISACISSYLFGKWMKKYWGLILITYTSLEISSLIGMYFLSLNNSYLFVWLIFSVSRGIIDYGINNILNFFLCGVEESEIGDTFGLFRFVYALSYLICSVLIGYISSWIILIITGVICIFSTICFPFFKMKLPQTLEEQFENSSILI